MVLLHSYSVVNSLQGYFHSRLVCGSYPMHVYKLCSELLTWLKVYFQDVSSGTPRIHPNTIDYYRLKYLFHFSYVRACHLRVTQDLPRISPTCTKSSTATTSSFSAMPLHIRQLQSISVPALSWF